MKYFCNGGCNVVKTCTEITFQLLKKIIKSYSVTIAALKHDKLHLLTREKDLILISYRSSNLHSILQCLLFIFPY